MERQTFSPVARPLVDATLEQIAQAMRSVVPSEGGATRTSQEDRQKFLMSTREQCLQLKGSLTGSTVAPSWSCSAAPSGRSS